LNLRKAKSGEILQVHPHCLMFFVDDTGQEEFADPKFPVFGMAAAPSWRLRSIKICGSLGGR
jgi:hypothetical protein